MNKKVLVDFASAIRLTLQESSEPGKHLIARGEFGRADVPTQNGRIYPRSVWAREIGRIQEAIKQGKVLGHIDHPASGKTTLEKASHIITGLEMTDDGQIVGEAKILNNEYGRQLRSILEAGGAIGISSRGLGSTMMGESGSEVVQEDYSYITHDFVADPAVITSYPRFQTEVRWVNPELVVVEAKKDEAEMKKEKEVESKVDETELKASASEDAPAIEETKPEADAAEKAAEGTGVDTLKADYEALVKEGKAESKEAKEKLEALLQAVLTLGKVEAQVEVQAGEEVKADSEAKETEKSPESLDQEVLELAVESVKRVLTRPFLSEESKAMLAEREAQIAVMAQRNKELEEGVEKLGATCNRLGAALYLERSLSKLEAADRGAVAAILGESKRFATVEQAEVALTEAVKAHSVRKAEEAEKAKQMEAIQSKMNALEEMYQAKIAEAKDRNEKLEKQLKESLDQAKQLGLRVYLEERVKDNPNASQIRRLCEGKLTKEEIDSVIKRFSTQPVVSEDYNSVRRRLEKFRSTQLVEEHLADTSKQKKRQGAVEGVDGEMEDLFPGVSLDSVKDLM